MNYWQGRRYSVELNLDLVDAMLRAAQRASALSFVDQQHESFGNALDALWSAHTRPAVLGDPLHGGSLGQKK